MPKFKVGDQARIKDIEICGNVRGKECIITGDLQFRGCISFVTARIMDINCYQVLVIGYNGKINITPGLLEPINPPKEQQFNDSINCFLETSKLLQKELLDTGKGRE